MEAFLALVGLIAVLTLSSRSLMFVPRGKAAIIERAGKYQRALSSGLHAIVPFRDKVRIMVSMGEQAIVLTEDDCLTADGRLMRVHCTLRLMITDAEKAVFSISDYNLALSTAARFLLREEIAKLSAEQLQGDIPAATLPLTAKLRDSALRWGIQLLGVDMSVQAP
jgi:regulator of protease activity HflC (stomatin/prohibitin superfamily)